MCRVPEVKVWHEGQGQREGGQKAQGQEGGVRAPGRKSEAKGTGAEGQGQGKGGRNEVLEAGW